MCENHYDDGDVASHVLMYFLVFACLVGIGFMIWLMISGIGMLF